MGKNIKGVICPVDDCYAKVTRLGRHLSAVHKLAKDSRIYKGYMAKKVCTGDNDVPEGSLDITIDSENPSESESGESPHSSSEEPPSSQEEGSSSDKTPRNLLATFYRTMPQYRKHITSVFGGLNRVKQASQKLQRIKWCLKHSVSGADINFQNLAKHLDRLYSVYKRAPSTVRMYMSDFGDFYHWHHIMFNTSETSKRQLGLMMDGLFKTLAKLEKTRRQSIKQRDMTRILSKNELALLLDSSRAREAKSFLSDLGTDPIIVDAEKFKLLRNFFVVYLSITNACRSGQILNLTKQNINEAIQISSSGQFSMKVADHKTSATFGDAHMILSSALYSLLVKFVKLIQGPFANVVECGYVFIKPCGSQMNYDDLSKILQSEFKYVSERKVSLTHTIIRKSLVTMSENENISNESRTRLARLMTHSEEVHARTYDLLVHSTEMAKATDELMQILGVQEQQLPEHPKSATTDSMPSPSQTLNDPSDEPVHPPDEEVTTSPSVEMALPPQIPPVIPSPFGGEPSGLNIPPSTNWSDFHKRFFVTAKYSRHIKQILYSKFPSHFGPTGTPSKAFYKKYFIDNPDFFAQFKREPQLAKKANVTPHQAANALYYLIKNANDSYFKK